MMRMLLSVLLMGSLPGCGVITSTGTSTPDPNDPRDQVIARAQVWRPTNVAAMDIKAGPDYPGAMRGLPTIECQYVPEELGGASPKFACLHGEDDELKVKFGGANAEVYGEVLATRLLWALGFGADGIYPVKVVCHGCPQTLAGIARGDKTYFFDPAVIERKLPAAELPGSGGWAWPELDKVSEEAGGAPRAHRDALTLLAVFLQHSDSKRDNQRIVCLDRAKDETSKTPDGKPDMACERPLMMMQDVGITFGTTSLFNANQHGVSLSEWRNEPVWKEGETACIGNIAKSATGTLQNPEISEEGRAFLAGLLTQLTDAQLRDLFEVSRVTLRVRDPKSATSGFPTVDEWVEAFKDKRRQIVERRCA